MIYPLAEDVKKFIYLERPYKVAAYHGSANFNHHLHFAGETSKVKQSCKALEEQQLALGKEVKKLCIRVNESEKYTVFKDDLDKYLDVNLQPDMEDMKIINILHKYTNSHLNYNLPILDKSDTSSDNDRGTVNPKTIGITQMVSSHSRTYREYNSNHRTRPSLDKIGKFSADCASNILKQHLCIQLLCFNQGRRDFNLSQVTSKDFNTAKIRSAWWKTFGTTTDPGPKSGEFSESSALTNNLDSTFIENYKSTRKFLRMEALSSLCPSLLDMSIDMEFKELLQYYIDSDQSDIFSSTNIESFTYADAIELISSAVAEAIAVRWSNDCGIHWDKMTCVLFNRTYFCAFKQKLSELRKGSELYEKLKMSAAIDPDSNEPYQSCMVAVYARKVVHNHCTHVATREMALKSPYFSDTAKVITRLIRITQGSILDYGDLFQNKLSLSEYYSQYKLDDDRLQMNGDIFKVPMTYSRIVSAFVFYIHFYFEYFHSNNYYTDVFQWHASRSDFPDSGRRYLHRQRSCHYRCLF